MNEKVTDASQVRADQFTAVNRGAALKTEDLRQAVVPDYEAHLKIAGEIEKN